MKDIKIAESTIVIIAQDTDFRETLKMVLDYSFEFKVTGAFKKVNEPGFAKITSPDIILADIADIKEVSGMKRIFPDVPVVAITADERSETVIQLFTSGISQYIFKGSEPAVYLNTLKEVVEEKIKISDVVIKSLLAVKPAGTETSADLSLLTSREKDILLLLSEGLSYKEIAAALKISIDTVKRHCYNIYQKSGVDNKIGAINKLLRQR